MEYLKTEQLGSRKWRVLAIPFYGPLKGGKDLDGEFFDAETDIKARWFPERPVIWHHDQDPATHRPNKKRDEPDDSEIGVEDDLTESKDGWWATVWLDRSNRYWEQVDALIRAGKMYGSSGALGHMVRKNRATGHIDVWPHVEQTLTPTPANPYARITVAKALAGFDLAGIDLDDAVRATLDADADDLRPDLPEPAAAATGGDAAAMRRASIDRIDRLILATKAIR